MFEITHYLLHQRTQFCKNLLQRKLFPRVDSVGTFIAYTFP